MLFSFSGDCSRSDVLRQKTATELKNNFSSYARHEHLNTSAARMNADIKTILHTLLEVPSDCDDVEQAVKNEGERTEKDQAWSSMLQVLALATVVGKEIISVFPDVEHYAKSLFHCTVKPIRQMAPDSTEQIHQKLVILWSRSSLDNDACIFVPDHVVPLIEQC